MEYEVRRIDIDIYSDYEKYVYCRYKEGHDEYLNKIYKEGLDEDDEIIKLFKKDFDMKIRKEICDKIMSGELPLTYNVGDWDSYDLTEELKKN